MSGGQKPWAEEVNCVMQVAPRAMTKGQIISLLHARSQGAQMDEISLRVLLRAAERLVRRSTPD